MDFVNYLQVVGGLAERPCALEIVKDILGLCYLFVHLEFPYVVRGSVVLQCYAGPGRYQEEAHILPLEALIAVACETARLLLCVPGAAPWQSSTHRSMPGTVTKRGYQDKGFVFLARSMPRVEP